MEREEVEALLMAAPTALRLLLYAQTITVRGQGAALLCLCRQFGRSARVGGAGRARQLIAAAAGLWHPLCSLSRGAIAAGGCLVFRWRWHLKTAEFGHVEARKRESLASREHCVNFECVHVCTCNLGTRRVWA